MEPSGESLGEETGFGAKRKGRGAQSFGGYEECDLYKFLGTEGPRNWEYRLSPVSYFQNYPLDASLVYEIEYHESENYRRFFKGHPHYNYFTHSSSESKHGPCLLSIIPFNVPTPHLTNAFLSTVITLAPFLLIFL